MTPPGDNDPLKPYIELLKTIAELFSKQPVILAFGGLIMLLFIISGSIGREIPDALMWFALAVIAFFIVMNVIDRWFDHQGKKLVQETASTPSTPTSAPTPPLPDPDEPTPANWESGYLRHLYDLHNQLPLALIDIREADERSTPLLLADIFTPLDVPAQQQRTESLSDEALAAAQADGRLPRDPVLKALSQSANKKLVLLGDPGSGKSTLVNYLTICLAGDHLGDKPVTQAQLQRYGWGLGHLRLLPVYVVLREYAAHGLPQGQSIWEFVAAYLQSPAVRQSGCVRFLKKRLEEEGGLVMLDGLDEVEQSDKVRAPLKTEILNFVHAFPKVRVVVTSRPYAYGAGWELPDFQVTRLLPFNDDQIETFINQWYTAKGVKDLTLGPEKAAQFAESLQRQVKQNSYLHELAEQPLLLTMMVFVHRGQEGGTLPKKRAKLYDESVKLLLDRWQRSKPVTGQETKSLTELLGIDIDELLNRLAEVAYIAHRDQPKDKRTADIPGKTLAGILYGHRHKPIQITYDRLVELLRDRAGLLADHGRNPDGDDIYRFPHRTFQEYLAGLHLLNDNNYPQLLIQETAKEPQRWRETVLLAAGSAQRPILIWTMAQELCPAAPPPNPTDGPTDPVWRAFLAAQVLADTDQMTAANSGSIAGQTRPHVQQWQRAIVEHGLLPPRDRALAGQALAALGDDRPGVLACDEMPLCTVPGGPFWLDNWDKQGQGDWYTGLDKPYWIGQYPVTAAQFRKFAQESGYKPRWGERPLRLPDNWPVVYINWYDALAFAAWLDKRWRARGWLPEGYRVTLPSEVEWEKAARGGQEIPQTPQVLTADRLLSLSKQTLPMQANARAGHDLSRRVYPWGDEPEQEEAARDGRLYRANNKEAGIGEPCAVGSFPAGASPYGCLDLSGQVWEWTRTLYGQKFPYRATPEYETIDAQNQEIMVLRGGSYYNNENVCSARSWYDPRYGGPNGFRVVVSPSSHR
ncbi:MAG: SUMF1/EgtB/PvdO family nonheme iron enzyme [Chloroflexi bacterium]|nr:SUMF1/EgtB/PvdO family nonheme iron enzyme [Ardenticatenaceae bacterium]MBL1129094.1 NACHT domain-containing protein [Chloroflexota bacterium]NOG35174.1 SUMF1/EgtB/PvdO family nonheme iron enzyme [Chloroflexota bacterium]GIK54560.1 MAG: hypothetical protein BroJett015_02230 [Chloroflexota bacterium]